MVLSLGPVNIKRLFCYFPLFHLGYPAGVYRPAEHDVIVLLAFSYLAGLSVQQLGAFGGGQLDVQLVLRSADSVLLPQSHLRIVCSGA